MQSINPGSKALRKGRVSEPGRAYLVTFSTRDRMPLFDDLTLSRIVVRCLNQSPHAKTLSFVVMPDHVHWLMQLRSTGHLSQAVRSLKGAATKLIRRQVCVKGPMWQKGFHDCAVRDERALRDMARYVVANPVRAGLVETVRDYPHWDAVWL